ncbi:phosphoglucomutase [Thermogladius sp. 4427co]|uniref:phosphoglucomutase n=1 Tax=Thermogladius sp. 4427co TaxID=3450718 RepID=UPI003F797AE3
MKLFGTAGIRMKYPTELNTELALKIGFAVSRLGLSRRAYIVYDSRTTSQLLSLAIAVGFMSMGLDTYLVGLAPTPIAGYAARKKKSIGVSVTASHNPPEYNGFKFYDPEGFEFTRELEKEIEQTVESVPEYVGWDRVGKLYTEESIVDEYIEDLAEFTKPRKRVWEPFVVVDLANGAAGHVTPIVLRKIGVKPLTVNANPDGFFPVRVPEPRKDVLDSYMGLYSAVKPAVILAHDGDADRLAVLDTETGFIKQDRLIAFFIDELCRGLRGKVVVSIDTGRVIDEIADRHGLRVERYVLGKTHEKVKAEPGIALAAEPWKLIYPAWGPWVDGVLQAAVISRVVVEEGKSFPKILEERGIREYPWDRRSFKIHPREKIASIYRVVVENLRNTLGEPASETSIDGVRYDYKDGSWILVRMSGTEPKIRFYAESYSSEKIRVVVENIQRVVSDAVSREGARIEEVTIG